MNFQIISRAEAIARGLDQYFTGKACKRGKIAYRRVNGGHCLCSLCQSAKTARDIQAIKSNPEIHEKRKEYDRAKQKKYKAKNPEKVKAQKKRHYEKHRESEAERSRVRRLKHGDRLRAKQREWREANRNHMQRYYQENKSRYQAHAAKRRAVQLNATPSWFGELDEFVITEAYNIAEMRSVATGIDWHVDHMVPLQCRTACGLHVWNNIQVIPARMNLAKKNLLILVHPYEWVRFIFP